MEIGSFIGLDLQGSGEYYNNGINIARLNSARAGIYHACKLYNCNSIYIPYYLPPSVSSFLSKKNIDIKYYNIDREFKPISINQDKNHAVLLVNYFGILSHTTMQQLASEYFNVIIDNSAAFYSQPILGCYNVYSPRKFFGVPDGCYVIGENAEKGVENYEQDNSSFTSRYLLKSIELGTSASYEDRMINEYRIHCSDTLRMSRLTLKLLENINYNKVQEMRMKNFLFMHLLFKGINQFNSMFAFDSSCVPMVYPLVILDSTLDQKLRERDILVGRLWRYLLNLVENNSFEKWLSTYMIPLPIDQRYNRQDVRYIHKKVIDALSQ